MGQPVGSRSATLRRGSDIPSVPHGSGVRVNFGWMVRVNFVGTKIIFGMMLIRRHPSGCAPQARSALPQAGLRVEAVERRTCQTHRHPGVVKAAATGAFSVVA
jgi:hypothetical protein